MMTECRSFIRLFMLLHCIWDKVVIMASSSVGPIFILRDLFSSFIRIFMLLHRIYSHLRIMLVVCFIFNLYSFYSKPSDPNMYL